MRLNPIDLADFRRTVTAARSTHGGEWEASRQLVEQSQLPITMRKLYEAVAASPWPAPIKEAVTLALGGGQVVTSKDLAGTSLKQLTGLPPIKALRALCVLLHLVPRPATSGPASSLSPLEVEEIARKQDNPFDLLLASPAASLLDLGAGDLTFAEELSAQYGPPLSQRGIPLTLHCLDRLDPTSRLGGPLHPEASRLERLHANPYLRFRYIGDRDMFDLDELDRTQVLCTRYSIVTCWAPATPTFAYEPSRLSDSVIQADLRRTKGEFRTVRIEQEQALEVRHQDRRLLFPPWKFDIRGPLALLRLMASRGSLCLLGAIDAQVFWEILAQLVEDPGARPADRLFTEQALAEAFGDLYRRLSRLPIGRALDLEEITELRRDKEGLLRFRHVRIRRGAVFQGIPSSSTAKLFGHMTEEPPPWCITLVPEMLVPSPS